MLTKCTASLTIISVDPQIWKWKQFKFASYLLYFYIINGMTMTSFSAFFQCVFLNLTTEAYLYILSHRKRRETFWHATLFHSSQQLNFFNGLIPFCWCTTRSVSSDSACYNIFTSWDQSTHGLRFFHYRYHTRLKSPSRFSVKDVDSKSIAYFI